MRSLLFKEHLLVGEHLSPLLLGLQVVQLGRRILKRHHFLDRACHLKRIFSSEPLLSFGTCRCFTWGLFLVEYFQLGLDVPVKLLLPDSV